MEIRRLSLCLAFLLVAVISQCSGAHHLHRRNTKYDDDDLFLSDGTDAEQNDAEQNDAENADYREAPEEEAIANIITKPAKYNVTVGRTVRLECKLDINETAVNWRQGEKDVVVANFVNTAIAKPGKYTFDSSTNDLLIHNLAPEDSGVYRCTVMQHEPAFIEHTLVVTELPKVVNITATDNGRPREGSDLTLTCDVTGSPAPKIVWTKEGKDGVNGQLTENDGEFHGNRVFIKKVTRANSGRYYCYAFNGVGGDQKGIYINVLATPHIHLHKTVVNSAINVEATLQCSVREEPPIKITWYKNGEVISSTRKTVISTLEQHSNLTVIPETDDDFGTYTCQAECVFGKHSRSVELVQRPVVEALEAEGRKVAFRVHSHQALTRIELQLRDLTKDDDWKIETVHVPEAQRHEYAFSHELPDDKFPPGTYEVVVKVKNTHGWSDAQNANINTTAQEMVIHGASISRHTETGSADISRPTVLLSTVFAYLLVRIL